MSTAHLDLPLRALAEWADRRVELKHKWFVPLAMDLQQQRVPLNDSRCDNVRMHLPADWEQKFGRLVEWVRDSKQTLNPVQLLDQSVFNCWPEAFRNECRRQVQQQFSDSGTVRLIDRILDRLDRLRSTVQAFRESHESEKWNDVIDAHREAIELLEELPSSLPWPDDKRGPLPKVLVIDDELGRLVRTGDEFDYRTAFARKFRLLDVERHQDNGFREAPVAEAYFCSGQVTTADGSRKNSLDSITDAIRGAYGVDSDEWSLILLDIYFETGSAEKQDTTKFGLESALPHIQRLDSRLPVIMISGDGSLDTVASVVRDSAGEFLHRFRSAYGDLLNHLCASERITTEQLRNALGVPDDFVVEDPATVQCLLEAYKAAQDPDGSTVLITGERGSGKKELGKFIHGASGRTGPCRDISCAALEENLSQSQLFGYYEGAFHGAAQDTPGKFHEANHGTLILDEFTDLPPRTEAQLLVTLESPGCHERAIEPVGNPPGGVSDLARNVDVRVICMTDQNLTRIRPALMSRFFHIINLPPLNCRRKDIVPIARHILRRELNRPGIELDAEAEAFLESLDYTDNVRHLQKLLRRAVVGKGERNIIEAETLRTAWRELSRTNPQLKSTTESAPAVTGVSREPGAESGSEPAAGISREITLSDAVRVIVQAAEDGSFGKLSTSEVEQIDIALKERLPEVVGRLAEWVFFRSSNLTEAGTYVFDDGKRHRTPKDRLKNLLRLVKIDPQVANRMQSSPYVPDENSALGRVIAESLDK